MCTRTVAVPIEVIHRIYRHRGQDDHIAKDASVDTYIHKYNYSQAVRTTTYLSYPELEVLRY